MSGEVPPPHHFYVTFRTTAPGVRLSQRLREKHPDEMTIVLQHQFWDLIVGDDQFEVGVSFNGVPERLTVPFAAIKGFFDPSVQFGLQFELVAEAKPLERDSSQDIDADDAPGSEARNTPRSVPRGAASEPEEMRPAGTSVPSSRKNPPTPAVTGPVPASDEKGGAEVVRLDKFRKK